MFSSLAHVTGNRVALGVGLSPWREDFSYLGLDWESRGRRMDECIEVVRGALTGEYFAHRGEFFQFGELRMKPVPAGPLKILVGGHSEPALKRAARVGDGWVSANSTYEELAVLIPKLEKYRREFGTADRPFEIHAFDVMLADAVGVERLAALGVTDAIAVPWNLLGPEVPLEEKVDGIARFGANVISRFR
jgi:alkanesulfonate monooxygenase SsuD/methylene tetrahydromethanopterin reductase-like flavin-dependent oxidoreductase (luciferase family)